jgi:hypothetical protein
LPRRFKLLAAAFLLSPLSCKLLLTLLFQNSIPLLIGRAIRIKNAFHLLAKGFAERPKQRVKGIRTG